MKSQVYFAIQVVLFCFLIVFFTRPFTYSQVLISVHPLEEPEIYCPDDIVVFTGSDSCMAWVHVPQPEIISSCGEYEYYNNYTWTQDASSIYPVGLVELWWHVIDSCGMDSCMMRVIVIDVQPPMITCPFDEVGLTSSNRCDGYVEIAQATAEDNCYVEQVWNNYNLTSNASDFYSVGTTEVFWYAEDIYGNKDSCMMNVTVIDTISPQITCPPDLYIEKMSDLPPILKSVSDFQDAGGVITDNCEVADLDIDMQIISGHCPRIIDRRYRAWDIFGNSSLCKQKIIQNDTIFPTLSCPNDTSIYTQSDEDVYIEIPLPDCIDSNGIQQLINDFNGTNNASGYYPVGLSVVNWTATDSCENSSSCYMEVQIINNMGFKDHDLLSFEIYPNPSSGDAIINIASKSASDITVHVVDLTGKEILSETLPVSSQHESHRVRVTDLNEGIYMVRVVTETRSYTKKLVVLR